MIFIPKNCYIDGSKVIQKRKGSGVATYCADDIGWTIEEEEEWNRLLEQLSSDTEERYESTESKSADRANDKREQKTEGSGHPRYSECTCGYRSMQSKISLRTHSDWCDYRKWREWDDKRKEYANIRIRFD